MSTAKRTSPGPNSSPTAASKTDVRFAESRAHALPGALAKVGEVLAIEHQKDPEGERLMAIFSMPRNPTKSDPRRRIVPDFDDPADEDAQRLKAYNLRDIEAEFETSWRTPDLCPLELPIWRSDQRINRRGVAIDLDAVAGAKHGTQARQSSTVSASDRRSGSAR